MNKCPICTCIPGNCSHLTKTKNGYVLKKKKKHNAQSDKYKICPLWRGSFKKAGARYSTK